MWYGANESGDITYISDHEGPCHPRYSPVDYALGEAYERDGALVAYTPDQLAARRSPPFVLARWSNDTMSWVDDRSPQERAEAEAAQARMAIMRVENASQRAMREAILAIAAAVSADPGRLAEVERQIQALRERATPRP